VTSRTIRTATVRWWHRSRDGAGGAAGQATVEFALVLPLVVALALAIVQVAVIVRDQILTVHAAREAARVASVDADPGHARAAATRVLAGVDVDIGPRPAVGQPINISVRFRAPTDVPLLGALVPDLVLHASASMVAER